MEGFDSVCLVNLVHHGARHIFFPHNSLAAQPSCTARVAVISKALDTPNVRRLNQRAIKIFDEDFRATKIFSCYHSALFGFKKFLFTMATAHRTFGAIRSKLKAQLASR
jgi:hypothetical protein